MRRSTALRYATAFLTVGALGLLMSRAVYGHGAKVTENFVHLGRGVAGVLYQPAVLGDKSQIAIFIMHSGADYLTFPACSQMAERGYRVLCANGSDSKSGFTDDESIDRMLLDAKLGVEYLRGYPGVRKIVLWGHSGGGTLMSAYEDIAQNGVKICQGPEKIMKCPQKLAGLPLADGVMLIDSNFGLAPTFLFSLDPAVVKANSGMKLNPALNSFNPKNGFNPAGSNYSSAFIHRFLTAQGRRNDRLIAAALHRWALIKAGKGLYIDDEPLVIPGGNFRGYDNRFFAQDVRLWSHTIEPRQLLLPGGKVIKEIVHTVRVPANPVSHTDSLFYGALQTTVYKFLTTYAIRVTRNYGYGSDSIHGIDWRSSYSSVPGNVEGIDAPLLVMGMTGHWEYMAAETIYDHAGSRDKTLMYVEGALHGYTTCRPCEKFPGQFGDTRQTTFNYIDRWLSQKGRFLPN
ncbi:MAG: alpha/beta hydrolase family protein [Chloroflexota bacterium]